MTAKPASKPPKPTNTDREARLKSALKANMAKRKAQAKARAARDNENKD